MRDAPSTAWLEIEIERVGAALRIAARGSRDERPAPHLLSDETLLATFAAGIRAAAARGRPAGAALGPARSLHQALFDAGIEQLRARLSELVAGAPLLLRLLVRDPELQAIPWEAVCAPDSALGFLGTSPELLPVRGVTSAEPWEPGAVSGALRVLAVSPEGDEVTGTLRDALAERIRHGEVEWLEPIVGERTEVRSLFQALRREPAPHVLHFLGHGEVRDGVPALLVGDADGSETWLPVELLAQQLAPAFRGPLRLVVLEACEGARPSAFASAAEALARAGAAAVVAHLWPVRASTARLCSEQLYRALSGHHARRGDIAASLNDARRAVLGSLEGSAEAFSPVLYLRATSGRLFDFGAREAVMDKAPAPRARPLPKAPPRPADGATLDTSHQGPVASSRSAERLALLIAWASAEPERVGEVALFEEAAGAYVLGRGEAEEGSPARVVFHRQRPGELERTAPLTSPGLSREQLRIRVDGGGLRVDRLGKRKLVFRGEETESCLLRPGDALLLRGQLLLHCTTRPSPLDALSPGAATADFEFGEPDAHGIVGESPAAWRLRARIAGAGASREHTLILGPSGSGKELAARAIHACSPRSRGPFIARSAATIPLDLVDAELFGNVMGYPTPGSPERPGLVGAAHGGTLFLDELGELPETSQSKLLRMLDDGGEYHPLGASSARRANVRVLAATRRDAAPLKPELAARLVVRVEVPGLDERRDDIPFLVRHLFRRVLEQSPEAARRWQAGASLPGAPELSAPQLERLLGHTYTAHTRELHALLWRAMEEGAPAES